MTKIYYCTAHTQDRILDEVRKCRELGEGNVCSWSKRYCSALKQYEETRPSPVATGFSDNLPAEAKLEAWRPKNFSRRPSLARTEESLAIEAEWDDAFDEAENEPYPSR